ncbi:MAG: arylsulfatase A-like enzyme [Saprospiraceae bacterium]
MKIKNSYLLFIVSLSLGTCQSKIKTVVDTRANIVLIVADDLGFSDLGCFGSEIATPNIDDLAHQGQIFNNYYTAATCSPTRAMLLSGCDNHVAGLGDMSERVQRLRTKINQPGYEGHLNDKVVSVATLIQDAGYNTYMAGKWHLGTERQHSPFSNGFDNSYALLDAYAGHFYPDEEYRSFWENKDYIRYPEGRFSTDLYTDKMIGFLKEDRKNPAPFFLYAAYTAPHWPLQAPQEYIDKYKGVYSEGYENLRKRRYDGLIKKGIISEEHQLSELPESKGSLYQVLDEPLIVWDKLSRDEQIIEAHKMEIYAAMIENLDHNIGRLINYLKAIDEYENTYFIFMSDNGAAASSANQTPEPNNPYPYMGSPNSFVAYGPEWAHASSTPYRLYKGYSTEGGIHSPLIIKTPSQKEESAVNPAFCTVKDLAPTFLEIAQQDYPNSYDGKKLKPLEGASMLPLLKKNTSIIHDDDYVMAWELFGRYAVRKGPWKITQVEAPFGKSKFELFNLNEDPSEINDVSISHPEIYLQMIKHWEDYVAANGVILTNY